MKLIDKDAIVAEIRKRLLPVIRDKHYDEWEEGQDSERKAILAIIDSLEVKEVDLEKEVNQYFEKTWPFEEDDEDIIAFAEYFFELGLKARIDKELTEEVYSHIDSIKDTADRMTSGNFMHNKAAIKFSANTIAKVLELMGLKTQKGE